MEKIVKTAQSCESAAIDLAKASFNRSRLFVTGPLKITALEDSNRDVAYALQQGRNALLVLKRMLQHEAPTDTGEIMDFLQSHPSAQHSFVGIDLTFLQQLVRDTVNAMANMQQQLNQQTGKTANAEISAIEKDITAEYGNFKQVFAQYASNLKTVTHQYAGASWDAKYVVYDERILFFEFVKVLAGLHAYLSALTLLIKSSAGIEIDYAAFLRAPLPMDVSLNAKYRGAIGELRSMEQRGVLRRWFAKMLNDQHRINAITEADVKTLQLVTASPLIDDLCKRYDHKYERFFFTLADPELRGLCDKIYPGQNLAASYVIVEGALDLHQLTKGLRIIISATAQDQIYHELRHTIDPLLNERKGADNLIAELVALYGGILHPLPYHDARHRAPSTIGEIRTFFEYYYPHFQDVLSHNSFKILVDRIVMATEMLSSRLAPQQVDLILFNCRTIVQLEGIANTLVRR
jgi:hypothetical protein